MTSIPARASSKPSIMPAGPPPAMQQRVVASAAFEEDSMTASRAGCSAHLGELGKLVGGLGIKLTCSKQHRDACQIVFRGFDCDKRWDNNLFFNKAGGKNRAHFRMHVWH
jgi:hypothetical protein